MEPEVTRASLLSRVRDPADADAWREFMRRYADLILGYCRSRGLKHTDSEDVRQVVLMHLSRALRSFRYAPAKGRFRDYLGATARHAVDRFLACQKRAGGALSIAEIGDPPDAQSAPDARWEQEWIDHHYRLAMRSIRETFEPRTMEVFDRLMAGKSAEDIARCRGLSVDAVYKIKQRVRDRLRELIDAQVRDEDAPDG